MKKLKDYALIALWVATLVALLFLCLGVNYSVFKHKYPKCGVWDFIICGGR